MRIAVASGKGGTGKTTIAVALARSLAEEGIVQIVDCDVEEPNVKNLLHCDVDESNVVHVPLPEIVEKKCIHCGLCARNCRYNALAVLRDRVMVFPELCNGCGACSLVCPKEAVNETNRRMGVVSEGITGKIRFIEGRLDTGQAKAVPVIDAAKERIDEDLVILDSPPGSSCPVLETARGADLILLVGEPTRFGIHDLRMVIDSLKSLDIPMVLVINKEGSGNENIGVLAEEKKIPVLSRLPLDRQVAEVYSKGGDLLKEVDWFGEAISELKGNLLEIIGGDPR